MLKTVFINTLKISVAAGLIYWLISSGKLDFKLLQKLGEHPWAILSAFTLNVLNIILVSIRWKKILSARSSRYIPLEGVARIAWIGQFFSSVLPGSVSGDLIKMLYVQKIDTSFSKKFIFASILIDRVMGLCGLILLVGMSSLIFGRQIAQNAPALKPILGINYLLTIGVITAFALFFFFHHKLRLILVKLQSLFLANIFEGIIGLWDDLVSIKSRMIKAAALSVIIQLLAVLSFWFLIYPFVGNHMTFVQSLAFIPIGNMALALPIAPSGLGVGHAIFQKLFEMSGISNGASLFNLYFVVGLVVNLLGVIPYLLTKSQVDTKST